MNKWLRFSFFILVALFVLMPSLAFTAHTNFRANLTGAQEVPAVNTNATGTAVITLTPAGLIYVITVNGLSGPITGAHFHFGVAGTNGPVVIDLTSSFGGRTTATGNLGAVPDSVVAALLTGRVYLNVHTPANPGGEIRGQVLQHSGTAFSASLEGAQEIPAVNTTAKGTATITLSSVGGVGLHYRVTVNGLSGNIAAAHFHFGFPGQNGPVVREITNDFRNNTAVGVWRTGAATGSLPDSVIAALLTGRVYLNVHTAANPGGEIRGQVQLSGSLGLTAKLDGAQEAPTPVTTNARGTASLAFTEYGLAYSITVDGLSGAIAMAHFHNAAAGTAGPVVRPIIFSGNTALGLWKSNDPEPLTAALLQQLLAGNIYINVHTAISTFTPRRIRAAKFAGRSRLKPVPEYPHVSTACRKCRRSPTPRGARPHSPPRQLESVMISRSPA